MKKKLLSAFTALAMVFTLLPATFPVGAVSVTCGGLELEAANPSRTLTDGTDYSYDSASDLLTIMTSEHVVLSNAAAGSTATHVLLDNNPASDANDINTTLTLNGVNISTTEAAAIKIADNNRGNVTVILADGTSNILHGKGGIVKNGDYIDDTHGRLDIRGESSGTGTLEAKGTYLAAGIGGETTKSGANITIYSGVINAIGGNGAGIGGGYNGVGSYITINGGRVDAATDNNGAGIGGGNNGDGSYITINGGRVDAKSRSGASIGGGLDGDGTNITINGGEVNAENLATGACIGGGNSGNGTNININGGEIEAICTSSSCGAGIGGGVLGTGNDITISGGDITVTASSGAGIGGGQYSNGTNITISGGTIHATSVDGAGIGGGLKDRDDGGNGDEINIIGSNVTAVSTRGAGIGGGYGGNGSNITLTQSTIEAESTHGAGIGGGQSGVGSNITIDGGNITATSTGAANIGGSGAGIGGGAGGSDGGNHITINKGTVNATSNTGAGIGGGDCGKGSYITINGGNITAISMNDGSGIGGGRGKGEHIEIKGGRINATSNGAGAGIGGGIYEAGTNIQISGGVVIASSGTEGAGIGGGSRCKGEEIEISGGKVTASSGTEGAGIGSGSCSSDAGNNITISGGEVIASADKGAGIGGGYRSDGNSITIEGGKVTSNSTSGNGIGGGIDCSCRNVTISGGTVTVTGSLSGIGNGANGTSENIFISGGSVKASSITIRPKNALNGVDVYLTKLPIPASFSGGTIAVYTNTLGTLLRNIPAKHANDDNYLYFYLPTGNAKANYSQSCVATVADNDTNMFVQNPNNQASVTADKTFFEFTKTETTDVNGGSFYTTVPTNLTGTVTFSSPDNYSLSTVQAPNMKKFNVDYSNNVISVSPLATVTEDTEKSSIISFVFTKSNGENQTINLPLNMKLIMNTVEFDAQPQDITVCEDKVVGTLRVSAIGSHEDAVNYEWYSCNADKGNLTPTAVTTQKFTVPTNLTVGMYHYICKATTSNGASTFSDMATVTVTPLLSFADSASFDIPEGECGTTITSINVSGGVSGGISTYKYRLENAPFWLTITDTGVISGTRGAAAAATTATVKVSDSAAPAHMATITINVGAVIAAAPLVFTDNEAYDIPGGKAGTAIINVDVSDGVSGGKTPYTFSLENAPTWLTINPATGVISGIRGAAAAATTATIKAADSTAAANTATITINVGAVAAAPAPAAPPTGGGSTGGGNVTTQKLYNITESKYSDWKSDMEDGITFRVDGDYSKFSGVDVDGKALDNSNFSAKSGSTIITLKPEYLKTLSDGAHVIKIRFSDGYVQTGFKITRLKDLTVGEGTTGGTKPADKPDEDSDSETESSAPEESSEPTAETTEQTNENPKTGNAIPCTAVLLAVCALSIITFRKRK